jgi:hypothetical protein
MKLLEVSYHNILFFIVGSSGSDTLDPQDRRLREPNLRTGTQSRDAIIKIFRFAFRHSILENLD